MTDDRAHVVPKDAPTLHSTDLHRLQLLHIEFDYGGDKREYLKVSYQQ